MDSFPELHETFHVAITLKMDDALRAICPYGFNFISESYRDGPGRHIRDPHCLERVMFFESSKADSLRNGENFPTILRADLCGVLLQLFPTRAANETRYLLL